MRGVSRGASGTVRHRASKTVAGGRGETGVRKLASFAGPVLIASLTGIAAKGAFTICCEGVAG